MAAAAKCHGVQEEHNGCSAHGMQQHVGEVELARMREGALQVVVQLEAHHGERAVGLVAARAGHWHAPEVVLKLPRQSRLPVQQRGRQAHHVGVLQDGFAVVKDETVIEGVAVDETTHGAAHQGSGADRGEQANAQ